VIWAEATNSGSHAKFKGHRETVDGKYQTMLQRKNPEDRGTREAVIAKLQAGSADLHFKT